MNSSSILLCEPCAFDTPAAVVGSFCVFKTSDDRLWVGYVLACTPAGVRVCMVDHRIVTMRIADAKRLLVCAFDHAAIELDKVINKFDIFSWSRGVQTLMQRSDCVVQTTAKMRWMCCYFADRNSFMLGATKQGDEVDVAFESAESKTGGFRVMLKRCNITVHCSGQHNVASKWVSIKEMMRAIPEGGYTQPAVIKGLCHWRLRWLHIMPRRLLMWSTSKCESTSLFGTRMLELSMLATQTFCVLLKIEIQQVIILTDTPDAVDVALSCVFETAAAQGKFMIVVYDKAKPGATRCYVHTEYNGW